MEMIWLCLFFNVHIVSKSPTEFSTPIGAFMELRSNANLPCFVNLAQFIKIIHGIKIIIIKKY